MTTGVPSNINDDLVTRALQLVQDLQPFQDARKISDADLIKRFLIARKGDLKVSTDLLRAYFAWRAANRVDHVLTEPFPPALAELYPVGFSGVDKQGYPVYWDRPDIKGINAVLQNYDRSVLVRWHIYIMERARERYRHYGCDRLVVVSDVSRIGVSILTNPTALKLLKDLVTMDQERFPEHVKSMYFVNAPWAFSSLYALVKPLLDDHILQKIRIWRGNFLNDLQRYIDIDQIPQEYGGKGGPFKILRGHPDYELPPLPNAPFNPPVKSLVPPPISPPRSEPTSPMRELEEAERVAGQSASSDDEFHTAQSSDMPTVDELEVFEKGEQGNNNHNPNSLFPTAAATTTQPLPPAAATNTTHWDRAIPSGASSSSSSTCPTLSSQLEIREAVDRHGFPILQCYRQSDVIAETCTNLVVQPGNPNRVYSEIQVEEGHYVHATLLLYDRTTSTPQLKFILRKRRLHREIQIFAPRNPDVLFPATGPANHRMQAAADAFNVSFSSSSSTGAAPPGNSDTSPRSVVAGGTTTKKKKRWRLKSLTNFFCTPKQKKTLVLSCRPDPNGQKQDWNIHLVAHNGAAVGEVVAQKVGNHVSWSKAKFVETPELIFTLNIALRSLWYFTE